MAPPDLTGWEVHSLSEFTASFGVSGMAEENPSNVPDVTPVEPAVAPNVKAAEAEAALPTAKKNKRPGVAPRRGKKLRNHQKNIVRKIKDAGVQQLKPALAMLKSMKRAKFDETVEVHMNLGIDPTQSDQLVRGSVSLPNGLGKTKRVLVFCQGDNVAKAKAAGADHVGGDELIAKVANEGFIDFDVAIATQDMMGKVSRLGKVLGPRNLMPTPKAGTVIAANADVAVAVQEQKAGKVEYRNDKSGQIHAGVGKLSFDDEKLAANIITFVEAVRAAKPSGVKGNYINGVVVSATMSPGIPVSV
ncbi:MAG: 50S ribosomal protein L1 [Bacteroidales bacterium]|nr:50S ribosomal protein L1 [Bacteroidales bacterium]